ncbi:MAG TPA: universal stress protein [Thermoanaerobaculia bacterium]|nr:universal stress protein [Thermoanaerobaculia bacterium]
MRPRRILVAVDGTPESRGTLAAAARLGRVTGAELAGLFVEDVELLRLAGLPFAREAGVSSGVFRRLETADIERRFRVAAERAREALREAASASGVRTSFRVTRGRVVPEILGAVPGCDAVAAGKRGGHEPSARRLGATVRSLLLHVRVPFLVGGVREPSPGPAVVLSPASDVPEEALRFVALLARAFGAPEVVLVAGGAGGSRIETAGIPVRRRGFPSDSSGGVKALLEAEGASAVVLIRPEGAAGPELLVALAEAAAGPVFVIGAAGVAELLSA